MARDEIKILLAGDQASLEIFLGHRSPGGGGALVAKVGQARFALPAFDQNQSNAVVGDKPIENLGQVLLPFRVDMGVLDQDEELRGGISVRNLLEVGNLAEVFGNDQIGKTKGFSGKRYLCKDKKKNR
jgi:hypothetical protein